MAQRITDKLCRTFAPPEHGQRIVFDDGPNRIKGFGLRVTPKSRRSNNGTRSFVLEYWHGGRQRRYTIGRYPDWKPEAARREAKELRKRIDRGEDPMETRTKLRTDPTVKDLATRYIDDHLQSKAVQSQKSDKAIIEIEILPKLGKRKVAEIHYGDIEALHKAISATRTVRANRVLAVLSKMFSLSLIPREGEVEPWRTPLQGNPCSGVKRNPEDGRERFYTATELERIADALAEYPGRNTANMIRFVMLTGCRPGEAVKATWNQFDLDAGVWTKPSAHTKQRKTHRVPLAVPATELLQKIRTEIGGDCPLVFPGRKRPGKSWGPLTQYNDCWQFVIKEANLKPDEDDNAARVYDLRHSFATAGVGAGLSLPLIGKLLGHTQHRTTQRYAHADDNPLREAVDKIADHIANAGKGGPEGETVTPLRGGRGA